MCAYHHDAVLHLPPNQAEGLYSTDVCISSWRYITLATQPSWRPIQHWCVHIIMTLYYTCHPTKLKVYTALMCAYHHDAILHLPPNQAEGLYSTDVCISSWRCITLATQPSWRSIQHWCVHIIMALYYTCHPTKLKAYTALMCAYHHDAVLHLPFNQAEGLYGTDVCISSWRCITLATQPSWRPIQHWCMHIIMTLYYTSHPTKLKVYTALMCAYHHGAVLHLPPNQAEGLYSTDVCISSWRCITLATQPSWRSIQHWCVHIIMALYYTSHPTKLKAYTALMCAYHHGAVLHLPPNQAEGLYTALMCAYHHGAVLHLATQPSWRSIQHWCVDIIMTLYYTCHPTKLKVYTALMCAYHHGAVLHLPPNQAEGLYSTDVCISSWRCITLATQPSWRPIQHWCVHIIMTLYYTCHPTKLKAYTALMCGYHHGAVLHLPPNQAEGLYSTDVCISWRCITLATQPSWRPIQHWCVHIIMALYYTCHPTKLKAYTALMCAYHHGAVLHLPPNQAEGLYSTDVCISSWRIAWIVIGKVECIYMYVSQVLQGCITWCHKFY